MKSKMPPSDSPVLRQKFLTVAEVATMMRVAKMTVYRLIHSGDLESVKVGRSFRIPEQAAAALSRAQAGQPVNQRGRNSG